MIVYCYMSLSYKTFHLLHGNEATIEEKKLNKVFLRLQKAQRNNNTDFLNNQTLNIFFFSILHTNHTVHNFVAYFNKTTLVYVFSMYECDAAFIWRINFAISLSQRNSLTSGVLKIMINIHSNGCRYLYFIFMATA